MKALSIVLIPLVAGIGYTAVQSDDGVAQRVEENSSIRTVAETVTSNKHVELGTVNWLRDYDAALAAANKSGKNVLILFQEVPGCSTCRNYGHDVLSDPLLVEAIENSFVPLAIFNNEGGKDRVVLNKYKEPSWNNPVVRIVDEKGDNVVPRVAGNYSAYGLFQAMKQSFVKRGEQLPAYLQLHGQELEARKMNSVADTHFKMYCFWSGERHLGGVEGVLSTRSGFMGGHEVVKVKYDKRKISLEKLQEHARSGSCSAIEDNGKYRASSKDIHYYLLNSDYRYVPLSELQKTKINAALGKGEAQKGFNMLSPKQQKLYAQVRGAKNKPESVAHLSIAQAWQ